MFGSPGKLQSGSDCRSENPMHFDILLSALVGSPGKKNQWSLNLHFSHLDEMLIRKNAQKVYLMLFREASKKKGKRKVDSGCLHQKQLVTLIEYAPTFREKFKIKYFYIAIFSLGLFE